MKRFYTAESVTEGHPDKLCDLIADSILDACLKEDENSKVACEVLATKGNIIVAGEITSRYEPQVFEIVRKVLESAGYEAGRHQLCVEDNGEKYGIFRGIANVELICENRMVIHILPEEQDLETIYQALKHPPNYLSLGRYEDLLDIQRVEIVELTMQRQVPVKRDCYIPVNYFQEEDWGGEAPINTTVYNLTKEYEITKQGLRRWKQKNG